MHKRHTFYYPCGEVIWELLLSRLITKKKGWTSFLGAPANGSLGQYEQIKLNESIPITKEKRMPKIESGTLLKNTKEKYVRKYWIVKGVLWFNLGWIIRSRCHMQTNSRIGFVILTLSNPIGTIYNCGIFARNALT